METLGKVYVQKIAKEPESYFAASHGAQNIPQALHCVGLWATQVLNTYDSVDPLNTECKSLESETRQGLKVYVYIRACMSVYLCILHIYTQIGRSIDRYRGREEREGESERERDYTWNTNTQSSGPYIKPQTLQQPVKPLIETLNQSLAGSLKASLRPRCRPR